MVAFSALLDRRLRQVDAELDELPADARRAPAWAKALGFSRTGPWLSVADQALCGQGEPSGRGTCGAAGRYQRCPERGDEGKRTGFMRGAGCPTSAAPRASGPAPRNSRDAKLRWFGMDTCSGPASAPKSRHVRGRGRGRGQGGSADASLLRWRAREKLRAMAGRAVRGQ